MNISVTVMAHPKRRTAAEAIALQLKSYPFVSVSIIFDTTNVEWETGKRALADGTGKGEWHVVIQDDAILTPHFYENIENAVNALNEKTLISLYTGTSRPLGKRVKAAVDKTKDGEWLEFRQLMWGVGIVIPTSQIEPMLEFVEPVALQYDNKIGEFYCRNGLPVYYCIPSLVDHDDAVGSLLGHGQSPEPRVAHRLATGPINWSNRKRYI